MSGKYRAVVSMFTIAGAVCGVNRGFGASDDGSVEVLIRQLGNEEFVVRQHAESRLVARGADAFDALQEAASNPDLEIASRAEYILHQIQVHWTRSTDPTAVRRVMTRYGELEYDQRRKCVAKLIALQEGAGIAALARIARFDTSPTLARLAALSVLSYGSSDAVANVLDEAGASQRVPIQWLRVWADQKTEAHELDRRWLPMIDQELVMLAEGKEGANREIVLGLLRFHLKLCLDSSNHQAAFGTLRRQVDFFVSLGHALEPALVNSLKWIIEHEQWDALQLLESHYEQAVQGDRRVLYYVAIARAKQGREPLAQQLADQAHALEDDHIAHRFQIAERLAGEGQHDWAEREWRFVVDRLPAVDRVGIAARRSLAIYRFHDRGENLKAAELLAESRKEIESVLAKKPKQAGRLESRVDLKSLISQEAYFRACHAESQKDYEEQQKWLEKSFQHEPLDPDVLIAMYRLEETGDAYRNRIRGYIRDASKKLEKQIQREPRHANSYNHWAWLIGNTEGDLQKAIRYSRRSLELSPDNPSYLDTLARCYYAAGDLENALKHQQRATELHPQLQVMRRQLELFERESKQREKGV